MMGLSQGMKLNLLEINTYAEYSYVLEYEYEGEKGDNSD
jgi:hypothetical protein